MRQKRELSKQIKTYQDSTGVLKGGVQEGMLREGGANKSRREPETAWEKLLVSTTVG